MKPEAVSGTDLYPARSGERDAWILARRSARNSVDPFRPYAFHEEEERAESGEIVSVATIFLTNRECPWHCLMCDLWKNTLAETVPAGAIPAQIDFALEALAGRTGQSVQSQPGELRGSSTARHLKLYNSGSFFDPRAIPPEDHPAIAARAQSFERVIVECHPSFVGESVLRFRDLLGQASRLPPPHELLVRCPGSSPSEMAGQAKACTTSGIPGFHARILSGNSLPKLEVAMGLETAHPEVLEKLNKRMTLDQFKRAAAYLREHGIALRAFVLVKPPFLDEGEALDWARRSLDFAFDCGATVVSLIPTRPGNGALEALMPRGNFSPPKLATFEAAAEYGISLGRGRLLADLWDLEKFSDCAACFPDRRARLREMNLRQVALPPVRCPSCAAQSRSGVPPLCVERP